MFMLGQARSAAYSRRMLHLASKAKTEHTKKQMLDTVWLLPLLAGLHQLCKAARVNNTAMM